MREVPRIVIVGRLSPEKGHVVLLEAVKKLKDEGVEVAVEIIGNGPFAGAIREQVEALDLENRVDLAGQLPPDEVARRLADADIFCMASFSEGLPISIMEAMAVGVPVVTTWISGIPELAVQDVTAMTVPPGNSDALAEAIKRLIANRALQKRLIAGARNAVERMHSREVNAGQLAEMFRALANDKVLA